MAFTMDIAHAHGHDPSGFLCGQLDIRLPLVPSNLRIEQMPHSLASRQSNDRMTRDRGPLNLMRCEQCRIAKKGVSSDDPHNEACV
jgi:hypothetical protein